MPNADIKENVRKHYAEIALHRSGRVVSSCCGSTPCGCSEPESDVSEDYSRLAGYVPEADLGLGCGIPVDIAGISTGDTVLDLGSGAGNDVFVARHLVGEHGRVIGVDMTEEMIRKANANNAKLGFRNVEFRLGEIENLPVDNASIDVVISNCVLNLVPDKEKAFAEIFRVLKPGGHFSISDIVLTGVLPRAAEADVVLYSECVSGALQKDEYLSTIHRAGFTGVTVKREKSVPIPDEVLSAYASPEEAKSVGIWSITVIGTKA